MEERQIWDRGLRLNSSFPAAWDASIARTTGCMWPHQGCLFLLEGNKIFNLWNSVGLQICGCGYVCDLFVLVGRNITSRLGLKVWLMSGFIMWQLVVEFMDVCIICVVFHVYIIIYVVRSHVMVRWQQLGATSMKSIFVTVRCWPYIGIALHTAVIVSYEICMHHVILTKMVTNMGFRLLYSYHFSFDRALLRGSGEVLTTYE